MYEKLPLINRYHAAWVELGTRIAQRQNAIQIFLASVAALFGFYFSNWSSVDDVKNAPSHLFRFDQFLFVGTLLLTAAATFLVWTHNRVIEYLCGFMARCEMHAVDEIRRQGDDTDDLFYFLRPASCRVDGFHRSQRLVQRGAISIVFMAPSLAAAVITFDRIGIGWLIAGLALLLILTLASYHDLLLSRSGN